MTPRCERIGNATLYLGDARTVLPTLSGIDAVVTDPPYGVNLGNHHGAAECRSGLLVKRGGYPDTLEDYDAVVPAVIGECLSIADRAAVFGVPPNIWKLPPPRVIGGVFVPGAVGRNGWGWSNLIHCLLYGTAPDLHRGAKPTAIYSAETAEETGHPTTKPLGWMMWAVSISSRVSETVLDPFMGSGTTGAACARLNRRFIGIEIEPKYFDIACRRIEQAQRQGDLLHHVTPQRATQLDLLGAA